MAGLANPWFSPSVFPRSRIFEALFAVWIFVDYSIGNWGVQVGGNLKRAAPTLRRPTWAANLRRIGGSTKFRNQNRRRCLCSKWRARFQQETRPDVLREGAANPGSAHWQLQVTDVKRMFRETAAMTYPAAPLKGSPSRLHHFTIRDPDNGAPKNNPRTSREQGSCFFGDISADD